MSNNLNLAKKPNAIPCRRCGRIVRPEKDSKGGKWRIPPLKLCYNCTEINSGNYDSIKILKAPKIHSFKELRSYLPFYIIDKTQNKLIKECKKLNDLSYLFNDYKYQRPTSEVFIVDTQSRNFTYYFTDNIIQ